MSNAFFPRKSWIFRDNYTKVSECLELFRYIYVSELVYSTINNGPPSTLEVYESPPLVHNSHDFIPDVSVMQNVERYGYINVFA
jgi:hypothetical protein